MSKHDEENDLLSDAIDAAVDGELECARAHFEGVIAARVRRELELQELYSRAWRDGWQAAKDGDDCVPHVPLDLLIGEIEVPA